MSFCFSCGKELEDTKGVAVVIPRDPITYEYCEKCFKEVRKNQPKISIKGE